MGDHWPAKVARLLLVAWTLLVLTLFAIAVVRQRPERPGAKAKHSDQPTTERQGGVLSVKGDARKNQTTAPDAR